MLGVGPTLHGFFWAATRWIPPGLAQPPFLASLAEQFSIVPLSVSHTFGLECLLGNSTKPVEFSFQVLRSESAELEAWLSEWLKNSTPQTEPLWHKLLGLVTAWRRGGELWKNNLRSVWVELDLPGNGQRPQPSIFLQLHCEKTHRSRQDFSDWLTGALLPLLGLPDLPLNTRTNLSRCLEFLPGDTVPLYLGCMLSRRAQSLRTVPRQMKPSEIIPFLLCNGWPGTPLILETELAGLIAAADFVYPALEISETVSENVAFECFAAGDKLDALLDELTSRSLCTEAEAEGLRQFPGEIDHTEESSLWPNQILNAASFLGPAYRSVVRRSISHIKVNWADGKFTSSKAYLQLQHLWRSKKGYAVPVEH